MCLILNPTLTEEYKTSEKYKEITVYKLFKLINGRLQGSYRPYTYSPGITKARDINPWGEPVNEHAKMSFYGIHACLTYEEAESLITDEEAFLSSGEYVILQLTVPQEDIRAIGTFGNFCFLDVIMPSHLSHADKQITLSKICITDAQYEDAVNTGKKYTVTAREIRI